MLIDCNDYTLRIKPKLPCSAVQDALVGLMWHKPVDIGGNIAGLGQRCPNHLADVGHCVTKYLRPIHADMTDGASRRGAAINIELVAVAAVLAQTGGEDGWGGERA